jgi:hypothetical protein
MSGFKITPQMVEGAFRVAALVLEYARDMGRKAGMTAEELEQRWQAARASNANTLADFIEQAGGVMPTSVLVAPPIDPPVDPALVQYGVVLDSCPPDSAIAGGTTVYYRAEDGKFFLWRIGVFTDPTVAGFRVDHYVKSPGE